MAPQDLKPDEFFARVQALRQDPLTERIEFRCEHVPSTEPRTLTVRTTAVAIRKPCIEFNFTLEP